MYIANMTRRGSLVTEGAAKTPTTRRHFVHRPGTLDILGSPEIHYVFPLFPYVAKKDNLLTINNIGHKLYVDHSAKDGGDGYSWSTAYNNLNELLNNPWLYYTCACQKQVVHVYVRGEVTYPLYRDRSPDEHFWGSRELDYKNYIVIHDAVFTWDTSVCVPFGDGALGTSSGAYSIYVGFWGINFYNCVFTLIQQNGKDGIGIDDDGDGASGVPPLVRYIDGQGHIHDEPNANSVDCLFYHYTYLKKCNIFLHQGNGGNGAQGSSNYARRTYGGQGGDSGGIMLSYYSTSILDECVVNVEFGSPGNGGDGADAVGGHGGDSGESSLVLLNPYKMYKCHISGNYTPIFRGGNGGSYTGYPGTTSGGNGGDIYTGIPFRVESEWCNHCTIDLTVDMQNAQAGDGGSGASGERSGYIITDFGARGVPGGHKQGYGSGYSDPVILSHCANSAINIHTIHYGTSLDPNAGRVNITMYDSYKSKINIIDDLGFGTKEPTSPSIYSQFFIPLYFIWCDTCTDVDVTLTFTRSNITLPSYGTLLYKNSAGDREFYSRGSSITTYMDYAYLQIQGDATFPSSYSSNGTYGMHVKMSKPPVFYAGYPGGRCNYAYGVVVHGADGIDKEYADAHKGGDASNEFTYNGLHVSAGTPGKGTYDSPDGTLVPSSPYTINSTTSKDVEITFI